MFSEIFKKVWFLWLLCAIFNIITLLIIYFQIHANSDKIVVLHYNVILGNDSFGAAKGLYLLPLAGFCISALNFTLYKLLKELKTFYVPLTAGVSLLAQLVILFVSVLILHAN